MATVQNPAPQVVLRLEVKTGGSGDEEGDPPRRK
jgi:hypothetical protein